MPDKTVTVTFNPTATSQFTFSPDPVGLNASGKINVNRAGGSTWTFTGISITGGGTQFTTSINPAGTSIQVNDAYTSTGNFCYTVTVSLNSTSYTSPDPTIVNEPPSPVPTPKPAPKPPPSK
jgi:hypothetical protein